MLTDNAKHLLRQRYCQPGEQPEQVYNRVAKSLSENNGDYQEFKQVMEQGLFLPNSPCLMNAGTSTGHLKACHVLPLYDSMESIYKTIKDSAILSKAGAGIGFNFSNLREENAPISSGGTSSGPISFMRVFNINTESVKQGGKRRGASIGILNYDHPDILKFVTEKIGNKTINGQQIGELTNFNLSVGVTDEFMQLVEEDGIVYLRSPVDRRKITGKIKARDLFGMLCMGAWKTGDPGLLFFDRINQDNPYKEKIDCVNPCGEVPLFPYESCCLGSINLSKCVSKDKSLDRMKLRGLVKIGTKMLYQINKFNEFPIPECTLAQAKYNRIGLGVMGFADMLIGVEVLYDSEEALSIIDEIMGELVLAKKVNPTSASVLSIAPTGSLSILADCSPSIEPIFSANYSRTLSNDIGVIKESRSSKYLREAHQVSPDWHLRIQSRFQKYTDSGVSKTINLPSDATSEDIKRIYIKAHKLGCKGITVFRDGSITGVMAKCEGESCAL